MLPLDRRTLATVRHAEWPVTGGDVQPGVFLIGSPKAGTTSLAAYLAAHPAVFCSTPKEPFHYCVDFPRLVDHHGFGDGGAYRRLFDAGADHEIVMEASTAYLLSAAAVPAIERDTDRRARYIVMVREPASLFASYHRTQLIAFNESVEDPRRAWELQAERQHGRHVPRTCLEPMLLQYRSVIALGEQVDRLLARVPAERVHVIEFGAFTRAPRAELDRCVAWLGLDPAPDVPLEVHNQGTQRHRVPALSRWLRRPPRAVTPIVTAARRRSAGSGTLRTSVRRMLWADAPRHTIPPALAAAIRDELADDSRLLAARTGLDLSSWPGVSARA